MSNQRFVVVDCGLGSLTTYLLKTYYVLVNHAGDGDRAENKTDSAVALVVLMFPRTQTGGKHSPSPNDEHGNETNKRGWGVKRKLFWIRWSWSLQSTQPIGFA